ncbi:MAG: acyl-CoA carboxylase subunit beta [Bryobacter sp.]
MMRQRLAEIEALEEKLRQGGGAEKAARQHKQGKWTARERVARLLDPGSPVFEVGLLVAYDKYDGEAPGAGVVTLLGRVEGRPVVVVANDATVKAGAWWPESIAKILRAQEIAMAQRIPILYLVDSAGVNLPFQDGIFPGQYGASRIFAYCARMRRQLHVPQLAAVMGMCIAGGAYLPALSDWIIMVEGTSFMGLAGPNLVKGATGENSNAEELGGAQMHTTLSGVAHERAANEEECLLRLREQVRALPRRERPKLAGELPARGAEALYDLLPADHRQPYDVSVLLDCLLDRESQREFQPDFAPELLCTQGRLAGREVFVMVNRRGFLRTPRGPRVGGIIYTESARKAAYFIQLAERFGAPLLFLQDVSGFMVGKQAEESAIIRAGAEMVEAMACAGVPKIVLSLNHSSGAGYYAMAAQGFDPDFALAWPTARLGVMEGDAAVRAIHGKDLDHPTPEVEARIAATRADYERWLDIRYAAARGHVDAIVDPLKTRDTLSFLLEVCAR